jgi:hypothetical protein
MEGLLTSINKLRFISIAVPQEQMMILRGRIECPGSFSRLTRASGDDGNAHVCGRKVLVGGTLKALKH